MKYRSKIDDLNLDPKAAKNLELDEQPRPIRKAENPTIPDADSSTSVTHRRVKGTRKAR